MITRWRLTLLIALLLASAAVSTLLLLQHHGISGAVAAVQQVCGTGPESGCDLVNRSPWSAVAGVPLAALGLAFAAALAALAALALLAGEEARAAAGAALFGALGLALVVDLGLLGLQAFSIHAYCKLCLLTYLLNAVGLVLLWPARRVGAAAGLRQAAGGLVLGGWAVALLLVLSGVAGLEGALRLHDQAQIASLLGGPGPAAAASAAAAPVSSPLPAGDEASQLRAAQQEVQRLQGILDDPRKLDQYFTEKAQREYDQAPVRDIDLRDTPGRGPQKAPVKLAVYSDFLCPFCRNLAQALEGFVPQTQGQVTVYYKEYPLEMECNPSLPRTVHQGACALALGGVCAQEQGKFWPYHDKVFAAPPMGAKADDVVKIAAEAGLDGSAMRSCLASPRSRERLAADVNEGKAIEVQATPTIFVNGRKLPRVNDLVVAVNKELARQGLPPLQPAGPGPAR